jgi:anti-anti-sigma regulatory factor
VIEVLHGTSGHSPACGCPAPVVFVDADTARHLERVVTAALYAGEVRVVVDLEGCADATSDLLELIQHAGARLRELGRSLGVVGARPEVRRLLDLTLLSHGLRLFDSRDEALRAWS